MQYVIARNQPFEKTEDQAIAALERQGFVLVRTFSLSSAKGVREANLLGNPGYSVLMLCRPGVPLQPLGLLTFYEQGGQMMLNSQPKSQAQDVEAELVSALVFGGLDFCVRAAGQETCVDPGSSLEDQVDE